MDNKDNQINVDDLILKNEGLATFYIFNTDKNSIPSKSMNVFYNQKMSLNRDITNLAISAYNERQEFFQ